MCILKFVDMYITKLVKKTIKGENMHLSNTLKTIFNYITMLSVMVTFVSFVVALIGALMFAITVVIVMITIVFDLTLSVEATKILSYVGNGSLKVMFIGLFSMLALYMLSYTLAEIDNAIDR